MSFVRARCLAVAAVAGIASMATAGSVSAQLLAPRPTLTLAAGPSPYDLSGTGTAFAAAARVDYPVFEYVFLETSLGYFRYESQGSETSHYLLPEFSVQAGPRFGAVRPYVGVGAGAAFTVSGPSDNEFTLHAVTGTRVRLSPKWGTRVEFRLRSVDPWTGNMGDVTFGVSRRI